jgi:hypothetical protein
MLIMTAVAITFCLFEARAGFSATNVNVRIDGYMPTPPGVYVQYDAGRPYYVERERRVYVERERPAKHHKKNKKHHKDHGNKHGHYE